MGFAVPAGVMLAASLASTAIATGVGVYSSIKQSQAQKAQMQGQANAARYQSEVARQNQQLAEQEASAKRRQGYEEMTTRRQQVARLIGEQRAAAGASGAAVDIGSNLDLQADTAAQGEIDAINLYNRGLDSAYQSQIQAWNFSEQARMQSANASAYESQASNIGGNAWTGAAGSALGGIASMGSTWANYSAKYGDSNPVGASANWDSVVGNNLIMRHPSGKTASVKI